MIECEIEIEIEHRHWLKDSAPEMMMMMMAMMALSSCGQLWFNLTPNHLLSRSLSLPNGPPKILRRKSQSAAAAARELLRLCSATNSASARRRSCTRSCCFGSAAAAALASRRFVSFQFSFNSAGERTVPQRERKRKSERASERVWKSERSDCELRKLPAQPGKASSRGENARAAKLQIGKFIK